MKINESFVHVAMREYLRNSGWLLIAGEFPNGSDDELNVLSISDPSVAKDNSPDPRRHSNGEIVPDLVAYKDGCVLIIEAKPRYSIEDKMKLLDLLKNKKVRLVDSLKKFVSGKPQFYGIDFTKAKYIPVLAFGNLSFCPPCEDAGFGHLYVKSLSEAKLVFFEGVI
ncbi:MAG: hypothetical protein MR224_04675 [Dorea sp.]|nr:hypothetical protein [Dorea sp.]